jgi:hypothetical protein
VVELQRNAAPVHLVSYYRYYRFMRDGSFVYRTTPQPLKVVHRSLRGGQQQGKARWAAPRCAAAGAASTLPLLRRRPAGSQAAGTWPAHIRCRHAAWPQHTAWPLTPQLLDRPCREESVFKGRYTIKGSKAYCVVVYPNSRSTEIRSILKIRGTYPGARQQLQRQGRARAPGLRSAAQPGLRPPALRLHSAPAAGRLRSPASRSWSPRPAPALLQAPTTGWTWRPSIRSTAT